MLPSSDFTILQHLATRFEDRYNPSDRDYDVVCSSQNCADKISNSHCKPSSPSLLRNNQNGCFENTLMHRTSYLRGSRSPISIHMSSHDSHQTRKCRSKSPVQCRGHSDLQRSEEYSQTCFSTRRRPIDFSTHVDKPDRARRRSPATRPRSTNNCSISTTASLKPDASGNRDFTIKLAPVATANHILSSASLAAIVAAQSAAALLNPPPSTVSSSSFMGFSWPTIMNNPSVVQTQFAMQPKDTQLPPPLPPIQLSTNFNTIVRQLAPIALPPPIRFVHPITTPRLIMDTVTFANDTRTVGCHQVGTAPRLGCYTTSSHPTMACTSSTVFASKNAPFFSSGSTLAASKLDSLETGIGFSMLRGMGWRGGGLGRFCDGIQIAPHVVLKNDLKGLITSGEQYTVGNGRGSVTRGGVNQSGTAPGCSTLAAGTGRKACEKRRRMRVAAEKRQHLPAGSLMSEESRRQLRESAMRQLPVGKSRKRCGYQERQGQEAKFGVCPEAPAGAHLLTPHMLHSLLRQHPTQPMIRLHNIHNTNRQYHPFFPRT